MTKSHTEVPFILSTSVVPKVIIPLSNKLLRSCNVTSNVMVVEHDEGYDFRTFFNDVVSYITM